MSPAALEPTVQYVGHVAASRAVSETVESG